MKQQIHDYSKTCLISAALMLSAGWSYGQTGFDIYMLDVKTGVTKQVSKIAGGDEFNPAFSNNGKKIVHDVVGSVAYPYGQTIYVTDVATGVSAPLPGAEGGNDAVYSPDGTTVAFDDFGSIYLVPANGGSRTTFRFNCHHASWNPQSSKIALDDNNGYIATKDITTGNETYVTGYGDRPSWSPNGQYIAFDGWWWIGGGIWMIKVDSLGNALEAPVQLTTTGYGPAWKNNSKEIVFVDWPDGDPNLYSIPVTGGIAKKIAGRVGGFDKGDYDAAYSNNGEYIAWSSYTDAAIAGNSSSLNSVSKLPEESKFILHQNYPNPFTDNTNIDFSIAQSTHVTLTIFNLSGQKIQTLADADYQAGTYHVRWDGKAQSGQNIPGGIYVCELRTARGSDTKKMILKK